MKKSHIFWNVGFTMVLVGFSVYALLDTFVISRVYAAVKDPAGITAEVSAETAHKTARNKLASEPEETVPDADSASETAGDTGEGKETALDASGTDAVYSDTSYKDEHLTITLSEDYEHNTTIHIADIYMDDPSYLKTALAKDTYGKNVKASVSETAEENDAILAINGDYYGARESGYVIREGQLFRSTPAKNREDLCIYADGSFSIINEADVSAEELLRDGVVNLLSFGPALVADGKVAVTENEEVAKSKTSNPRTAIGIIGEGHYVFVVSDGRTEDNEGLSLYDLAEYMKSLGCTAAYNLDGGGSSTMVFNGKLVNQATGGGHGSKSGERSVSDIVFIGY